KKYNNLKKDVIRPKQVLLIPPADAAAAPVPEKKAAPAKGGPKGKGAAPAAKKGRKAIPADGIHKVSARENFTTIARMYGITVADMVVANPGVNSAKLKVGQSLKIVAGAGKSGQEGLALPPPGKQAAEKESGKSAEKKAVKKNAKQSAKGAKGAKSATKGEEAPPPADKGGKKPAKKDSFYDDEDLLKGIQSPEEAAAAPAAAPAPAAPAGASAPSGTPAPAAASSADSDLGDDAVGEKMDKVVNTPDGKTKIILARDTTVEQIAEKYATTAEALRKENSNIPASGELKVGMEIFIGGR
ncbi:MAG: LysM peptidoglycan-binding domain-containing protein, partial [Lentisphaeria bacterium]|nr:LysM peptidoglycan-binding domain-containing protein [Lentisphaeria bacterium]